MCRGRLLLLVLLLVGAIIGALLAVGAFPPGVTQQPVERTLPNERFGRR